jgi:sulfhydrogenase subunit beta (sulfur reductase)
MALWILPKEEVPGWVERLMADFEVVGPVAKENAFAFAPLRRPADLRLDYPITLQSPKEYLLPPEETLLRFKRGQPPEVEPVRPERRRVLFGVHPCDINATWLLDLAFSQDTLDTPYMERRERTLIVGLDCLKPCDDRSFCKSMGSLEVTGGYDLFLTDLGDVYAVEAGTEMGQELLERYAEARPATEADTARLNQVLSEKWPRFKQKLNLDPRDLAQVLELTYDDPLWEELAQKCLGCGSCNLVCPTCYCFDVQDRLALDLQEGERVRRWDGCMLRDFTLVASGEVFREHRSGRLRHRFYRKGKYMFEDYGRVGCVGCGRCVRACLVKIDPVEVFNTLESSCRTAR